jgi:hypothetical protein
MPTGQAQVFFVRCATCAGSLFLCRPRQESHCDRPAAGTRRTEQQLRNSTPRTKRDEIPLKLERRSAWRNRAEYVSFR